MAKKKLFRKKPGRKLTNSRHPHTLETREWRAKNREQHNWYQRNYKRMKEGKPVDPEFERQYGGGLANQVRVERAVERARARQAKHEHEIGIKEPPSKRRRASDVPPGLLKSFGVVKR